MANYIDKYQMKDKGLDLERTEPDDINLIYPKFKTKLKYEIPSINIKTKGDFSVIYNMKSIEPKNYYNSN